MLLNNYLIRPTFAQGMSLGTAVFRKYHTYLESKFKILALGGLGYGILQGYQKSLRLAVEGSLLVVKSGAAIDKDGNIIYLPKTKTIQDEISIISFNNKQYLYVYIKYKEEKTNAQPHAKDATLEVYHDYSSNYAIEITEAKHTKSEWIELGRILIDYDKKNQYDKDIISEPFNPFLPRENEIDLRYVPKIITNLIDLDEDSNQEIYTILGNFADYLNEIAFKYRLLSAVTASSFVYQVREDIFTNIITPYDFYSKLEASIKVVAKIKDENENIVGTDFWKPITQLITLFSIGYGKNNDMNMSFHKFDISEKSYFRKILYHFQQASHTTKEFNFEVQEESVEEEQHKGYVQVGRSANEEYGNDLIFPDDNSISRVHLVVTAYKGGFFIEDMSSTGTYVNAQRVEKGVKQFVRPSDEIVLGRKGTKLNLNEQKIQDLLNL